MQTWGCPVHCRVAISSATNRFHVFGRDPNTGSRSMEYSYRDNMQVPWTKESMHVEEVFLQIQTPRQLGVRT
jgi:hypothetical protein